MHKSSLNSVRKIKLTAAALSSAIGKFALENFEIKKEIMNEIVFQW